MKKLALASALTTALCVNPAFADDNRHGLMTYHVTITNTTTNHVITPPIVIAHKKGFHLFHVGNIDMPASPELATLAETGDPEALAEMLIHNPKVTHIEVGSYVKPGMPYTVTIEAPKNTMFTVAGMLASSNDAFTAAVSIKAPKRGKHNHSMGMTFDAGSEANNEECAYVPGPPCAMDSGNEREAGEGMVTIHSGIYGKADLAAADLDWRGPTSIVSIHNDGRAPK